MGVEEFRGPDAGYLTLTPGQKVELKCIGEAADVGWLFCDLQGQGGWFTSISVVRASARDALQALVALSDAELRSAVGAIVEQRPHIVWAELLGSEGQCDLLGLDGKPPPQSIRKSRRLTVIRHLATR